MTQSTLRRWTSPEVILVATNFLEGSSLMIHAIDQAKFSGAKIMLVHVVRPSTLRANSDPRHPCALPISGPSTVQTTLDQMVRSVERYGIPCEPVVLKGAPAEQISLLVKNRGLDRVIIATRSLCGVERLLMGSVAEELTAILEVPVCIVGNHAHPGPNACVTRHGRILVADSFHPSSALCTSFACAFAEVHQAHLTLLHVLDSDRMGEAQREHARVIARQELGAYIPSESKELRHPLVEIREGDAATQILEVASLLPYDFIILGSAPDSRVCRILASTVIHRVVSEAGCPVITIKPLDLKLRLDVRNSFSVEPVPVPIRGDSKGLTLGFMRTGD